MEHFNLFITYISFLWLPFIGGLLITLSTAPLGVFVVWQRQSYFGATVAHSALLGVSLSLLLQWDLTLTIISVAILVAVGIHWLGHYTELSSDTLLGMLAHSSLALGLILLSFSDNTIDVMSYLFGDILTISLQDIFIMFILFLAVFIFFWIYWQDMLNISLNKTISQVEGVKVKKVKFFYTILLALTIALSMKVVGVLLITALLIIPPASARYLSHSPEQMFVWSLIFGVLSLILGMISSFILDLPTGAMIVIISTIIFITARVRFIFKHN